MKNSLLRARRIGFFGAVEAASELARGRSTRQRELANPWLGIRADRRARYLSGEGRISHGLLDELTSEFPEATKVWRSDIWEFLELDRSPLSTSGRLYEELGISRSSCSVNELLQRFHDGRPLSLGAGLDEVSARVLALRAAIDGGLSEAALTSAGELAKALLTLAACPYRRSASEQLWYLCGHAFVRGLQAKGRRIRYKKDTWVLIADHAIAVTETFKLMAYASPSSAEIPYLTAEELMRDIVLAVTTEDLDRATFIMSRFNVMSPLRRLEQLGDNAVDATTPSTRRRSGSSLIAPRPLSGCPLPDVEKVSIWGGPE